jgi:hypothetical protein
MSKEVFLQENAKPYLRTRKKEKRVISFFEGFSVP